LALLRRFVVSIHQSYQVSAKLHVSSNIEADRSGFLRRSEEELGGVRRNEEE
jgi:hypothetical protein